MRWPHRTARLLDFPHTRRVPALGAPRVLRSPVPVYLAGRGAADRGGDRGTVSAGQRHGPYNLVCVSRMGPRVGGPTICRAGGRAQPELQGGVNPAGGRLYDLRPVGGSSDTV